MVRSRLGARLVLVVELGLEIGLGLRFELVLGFILDLGLRLALEFPQGTDRIDNLLAWLELRSGLNLGFN